MKKLLSFVVLLMCSISCLIFSACGDIYKNLKMTILDVNGKQIDSLTLIVDEQDNSKLDTATINVKIDGIKVKDIGEIEVQSYPTDLAFASVVNYDGNICQIKITAGSMCDKGKLKFIHMSSNKTVSIDLVVSKKSYDLSLKSEKYVIAIGEDDINQEIAIDTSNLINLYPNGSMDKIYFAKRQNETYSVSFNEEQIENKSYIVGFKLNSSLIGKTFSLNPVTYQKGYEVKEYSNKPVEFVFIKKQTSADISLTISHNQNQNITENPIYLIGNDNTFNYNHVVAELKLNNEPLDNDNLLAYYDYSFSSHDNLLINRENNKISIQANDYMSEKEDVIISLVPKYAGNYDAITKTIPVKGELKPTQIEVSLEGQILPVDKQDNNAVNATIYDYYQGSKNTKGSLFKFSNIPSKSFKDLSNMQIKLNIGILNAVRNGDKGLVGLNPVYDDENFDNIDNKTEFSSNKYLLNFYKNSTPLKFYVDNNVLVSEQFNSNDVIYIKYVENSSGTENIALEMDVECVNNSQIDYLKNIDLPTQKIKFNNSSAVKDLKLKAGYSKDDSTFEYIQDDKNVNILVESIYLDKNDTKSYFIEPNEILDINQRKINFCEFTVSVNKPGLRYNSANSDEKGNYKYDSSVVDGSNCIYLSIDEDAEIGEYTITFTHESGYVLTIPCYVYEGVTKGKIDYEIVSNDNIINNINEESYIYSDYEVDYIVSAGSKIKIKTKLNEQILASNVVNGYDYSISTTAGDIANFVSVTSELNDFKGYTFNEGTYVGGVKTITITLIVKSQQYTNILTKGKIENVTKDITFYVYEDVMGKIALNETELTKYFTDSLGLYNKKEEGEAELSVNLDDNLWNYLQEFATTTGDEQQTKTISNSKVKWEILENIGYVENAVNDKNISITSFKNSEVLEGKNEYNVKVKASVWQFGRIIDLMCNITVKKPYITEDLIITSPLKKDELGNLYLNLKAGETYKVTAEHINEYAEVTHKGITLKVIDRFGNVITTNTTIIGDEIIVNNDILDSNSNLKLLIISTDAINEELDETGLNNIERYLLNSTAYKVIDLYLSSGSKTNPFLITNSTEFKDIANNLTKHYKIMNSINLSGVDFTIDNFTGSITADENNKISIYGLELNNTTKNLFTNFYGEMSNIHFDVTYDYSELTQSNLGVFSVVNEDAVLTNVSATISGEANLKVLTSGPSSIYSYFGGLVGENRGKIQYTNPSITAVNGAISFSGDGYFGGLVGFNNGEIVGYQNTQTASEKGVNFNISINRQGALIDLTVTSSETGGAIGLVGGKNTGTLTNGYVYGSITDNTQSTTKTTCAAGGIIGENVTNARQVTISQSNSQLQSVTIPSNTAYVSNVTSSVKINIENATNVGGIVGVDNGGYYSACRYQITTENSLYANANVGGIAGKSTDGVFEYCSVFSYRKTTENTTYDIVSTTNAGGIIGLAVSTTTQESITNDSSYTLVTVSKCSVNANISGTSVGGLLCNYKVAKDKPINSIIIDAYFIGYINTYNSDTTNDDPAIILTNNTSNNSVSNYVYAVVNGNTETIKGFTDNERTGWAQNDKYNGGYIYLVKDDEKPIFEIAPTSIELSVKDNYKVEYTKKLLNLYYYEYSATDDNYLKEQDTKNTYTITDYVNISCAGVTTSDFVQLVATSDILEIRGDTIIVRGVGSGKLKIFSAINPDICGQIDVYIAYPIGNETKISDSVNSSINSIQQIAKGNAKQYYLTSYGTNGTYSYKTNDKVNLKVEITGLQMKSASDLNFESNRTYYKLNEGKYEIATNITSDNFGDNKNNLYISEYISEYEDYLNISNVTGQVIDNKYTVYLDYKTPLYISVLKHLQNGGFEFTVTPYLEFDYNGEKIKKYSETTTTFTLKTFVGATNLSLSFNNIVLYPNDTTYLTAYVDTDIALTDVQINNMIPTSGNYTVAVLDKGELNNGRQIVKFKIVINGENVLQNEKTEEKLKVTVNSISKTVNFTILRQRINKIEIKNYYSKENDYSIGSDSVVLDDVIRPTGEGRIIIKMAPNNAYYDYLEITDITGIELITFNQLTSFAGGRLQEMETPSSDGNGIKLVKPDNNGDVYVSSKISSNYSSKPHTIQVSAFLNDGTLLTSNQIVVEAKMLPEIKITYIQPNNIKTQADSFIANGCDADLYISTKNSDGNIDIVETTLSNNFDFDTYYMLEKVSDNGHYKLRYKLNGLNDDLLGKTITIKVKTKLTLNNNEFETATDSFTFTIKQFVIHDISVNNSVKTLSDNQYNREIYGNFNVPIDLEFYFTKTDISLFENRYYTNTYRYSADIDTTNTRLNDINAILSNINNYLSLNFIGPDLSQEDKNNIATLINNELTVKKDAKNVTLDVKFKLEQKDNNSWQITVPEANTEPQYSYNLNFAPSLSEDKTLLVQNDQDFLNMIPKQKYTLCKDITLKNYVPFDLDMLLFDGNGHTITIESFSPSSENDVVLGLFKSTTKNTLIKNLNVKYSGDSSTGSLGYVTRNNGVIKVDKYLDICSDSTANYASAKFGGITATNNGIITNCSVSGDIALSASKLEQLAGPSGDIAFDIGGLVTTNESTGYITNSCSSLNIAGLANIGGFVYDNLGVIASSCYEVTKESDFGIYAYNNSLEYNVDVKVAGFAYTNSNKITMSYVDIGYALGTNNSKIMVNNKSAGFVFENANTITDCYCSILDLQKSENNFSGFVTSNTGTIKTSYTNINKGNNNSNIIDMFAPNNQTGFVNCVQIVGNNNQTKPQGVNNVLSINRAQKSQYSKFSFGDNISSVWKMEKGVPKLVSTLEKVVALSNDNHDESFDNNNIDNVKVYFGLRTITIKRIAVTDENGITSYVEENDFDDRDLGSKTNPYIIYDLESWLKIKNNSTSYYRLVKDIEFSGANPITSGYTFGGNIQGNNMSLTNIELHTANEELSSIGLFKEMKVIDDSVNTAVRNITISANSVNAIKTSAVGILAGIIDGYNLYNIDIVSPSESFVVVGGNAVGGLAGIIKGRFDLEFITSNVSVNSTRSTVGNKYAIYNSYADGTNNLKSVFYSGSVAGILDYQIDSTEKSDYLSSNYVCAKDIYVLDSVTAIGEIVGSQFGFVNKDVKLENVYTTLKSGRLSGERSNGGIVGENRGVIINANFNIESDVFSGSNSVSGGIVGLNIGGLILNSYSNAQIVKTSTNTTVGGIVGRNIDGYVLNSTFDGKIIGYFAGGIVGSEYSVDIVKTGKVFIDDSALNSIYTSYTEGSKDLTNYQDCKVTASAINYWFENQKYFHSYQKGKDSFVKGIIYNRVLGLVIGVSSKTESLDYYAYDLNNKCLIVSNLDNLTQAEIVTDDSQTFEFGPEISYAPKNLENTVYAYSNLAGLNLDYTRATYIVGYKTGSFDSWGRSEYSNNILLFTKDSINNQNT